MKISIVIPTLNEAASLPVTLAAIDEDCEVLVCDGGSTDGTPEIARRAGARIILRAPGRGQQLHAGTAVASGEVLLFLHADTILLPGALAALGRALADPSVTGGNFRVVFDGPTRFAAWLTGFYAWLRNHGLYYGDSAIFVRRTVLDDIGGMRPIALMEDYDLVRRLERNGGTVCIDEPPVITSSRRFEGRPRWRIFSQWVLLHALFHARVSPDTLARLYRSAAHSPAER